MFDRPKKLYWPFCHVIKHCWIIRSCLAIFMKHFQNISCFPHSQNIWRVIFCNFAKGRNILLDKEISNIWETSFGKIWISRDETWEIFSARKWKVFGVIYLFFGPFWVQFLWSCDVIVSKQQINFRISMNLLKIPWKSRDYANYTYSICDWSLSWHVTNLTLRLPCYPCPSFWLSLSKFPE